MTIEISSRIPMFVIPNEREGSPGLGHLENRDSSAEAFGMTIEISSRIPMFVIPNECEGSPRLVHLEKSKLPHLKLRQLALFVSYYFYIVLI